MAAFMADNQAVANIVNQGGNINHGNIQQEQMRLAAAERDARIAANLSGQLHVMGNGMAQQNLAQNRGFNIQGGDVALGADTLPPLPFDEQFDKQRTLAGIIRMLPTGEFGKQEQLYAQMQTMTPEVRRAYKLPHSVYEGVPDSMVINRVNIFNQRDRENRLYAFV